MSLLQHPLRTLEQIDWYLDSRDKELFPGAFLLSAGNLARQVLEQVLFILAFYSGMPRDKFLRSSNQLRTADAILKGLQDKDPKTGRSYMTLARRRGSRIRKFARFSRSLDRWRRLFNEPSHFSNPAAGRRTKEHHMREFVRALRNVFEEVDGFLITAAVNDIRTNGFIKAVLGNDPANTPGVECTAVITPNMIHFKDGQLSIQGPKVPMIVVSDSKEVPYRWRKRIVMVQRSHGMELIVRMVTESGQPLNLHNFQTVIDTWANDPRDRQRLIRRMKKFGLQVELAERQVSKAD